MTTTIKLTLANREVNRLFTRKLANETLFYEALMQKIKHSLGVVRPIRLTPFWHYLVSRMLSMARLRSFLMRLINLRGFWRRKNI